MVPLSEIISTSREWCYSQLRSYSPTRGLTITPDTGPQDDQPLVQGDEADFDRHGLSSHFAWVEKRRGAHPAFRLLLFIVITLFIIFTGSTAVYTLLGSKQVPRDIFGVAIPMETRLIQPLMKVQDSESWAELLSDGKGYIYIENPNQYGLPPGLPAGDSGERKLYGLSWGHQIHCLIMIRKEYRRLLRNESEFTTGEDLLNATSRARLHHIEHCFDYLRQNIECSGDITIEWAASKPDELGNPFHIDGYGIPHLCRKREFVEGFSTNGKMLIEYSGAGVNPWHDSHYH